MERRTFRVIEGKRLRKLPKSKLLKRTKRQKPDDLKKIPSIFKILQQTLQHMWRYKRPFIGVMLVYAVLMLLFVKGLSNTIDINGLKQELSNGAGSSRLSQNLTLTGVVATSGGNTTNDVASVYQSTILIIAVLAFIWLFRQTSADKKTQKILVRQPFYEGMEQLIPFLLVLFVVGLQLLPMLIGLGIFNVVQANGLIGSLTELILWGLLAFLLSMLTLYWLSSSAFALIIVTLSKERPVQALRSAKKLVAFRRSVLMRKLLALMIILFVATAVLLLLVISVVPAIAEYTFLCLGALTIPVAVGSIYKMYRAML